MIARRDHAAAARAASHQAREGRRFRQGLRHRSATNSPTVLGKRATPTLANGSRPVTSSRRETRIAKRASRGPDSSSGRSSVSGARFCPAPPRPRRFRQEPSTFIDMIEQPLCWFSLLYCEFARLARANSTDGKFHGRRARPRRPAAARSKTPISPAVVECLARNFPERTRDYWRKGFAAMARRPRVAELARATAISSSATGAIVGVLLQIRLRRARTRTDSCLRSQSFELVRRRSPTGVLPMLLHTPIRRPARTTTYVNISAGAAHAQNDRSARLPALRRRPDVLRAAALARRRRARASSNIAEEQAGGGDG